MDFAGPEFVLAIIAMSTIGWIATSWIRAKHGYPLENEWSGTTEKTEPALMRQQELLSAENASLKSAVVRLEERIAVLERIATDPGVRVAKDIEALR
ncbi:MAG: hypothetical protein INF91_12510 [Alphaproteobacteria bacterium]|nr:hypothetical protein [Alphaproteobacteria bacterium]